LLGTSLPFGFRPPFGAASLGAPQMMNPLMRPALPPMHPMMFMSHGSGVPGVPNVPSMVPGMVPGFGMFPSPFMIAPPRLTTPIVTTPIAVAAAPKAPLIPPSTVYVGRIPPDVEDEFMRRLLSNCGAVSKWTRITDPETGQLKSFGFCEYAAPQSALRALRLIKDIEIDVDKKLLLNVDQKTKKILDEYEATLRNTNEAIDAGDDKVKLALDKLMEERTALLNTKKQQLKEEGKGSEGSTTVATNSSTTSEKDAQQTKAESLAKLLKIGKKSKSRSKSSDSDSSRSRSRSKKRSDKTKEEKEKEKAEKEKKR